MLVLHFTSSFAGIYILLIKNYKMQLPVLLFLGAVFLFKQIYPPPPPPNDQNLLSMVKVFCWCSCFLFIVTVAFLQIIALCLSIVFICKMNELSWAWSKNFYKRDLTCNKSEKGDFSFENEKTVASNIWMLNYPRLGWITESHFSIFKYGCCKYFMLKIFTIFISRFIKIFYLKYYFNSVPKYILFKWQKL